MAKDPVLPQASRIKTPEEELQILAELADSTYFVILKRTVRRFVEVNKNAVFLLHKDDPKLILKMTELTSEAQGMNRLIKLIEGARIELAKRNKDRL